MKNKVEIGGNERNEMIFYCNLLCVIFVVSKQGLLPVRNGFFNIFRSDGNAKNVNTNLKRSPHFIIIKCIKHRRYSQ